MRPPAIVMNMFYTGLGVARSLGGQGIPVVGLSARRGIYGNYTRFAKVRACPDSREQPEALLAYLLQLAGEMPGRPVIFPTRDDDVLFLDRYREPLGRRYDLLLPSGEVLTACLDKWQTYRWAKQAGIDTPRCWLVENENDLARAALDLSYPCVMKPVSSHLWRKENNWQRVGGRKAFAIDSYEQLTAEYEQIFRADPHVLIQEMVPGPDDRLFVAACYLDRDSRLVAGFTAQKLLQSPAGFGTGCIVQTVQRPDLMDRAFTLLQAMRFTGIAEVEFKRHPDSNVYQLIEINARPWDQHELGRMAGVNLIHVAYCDHAGLPLPAVRTAEPNHKWIAEDVLLTTALRLIWKRDPQLRCLFSLSRGKRTFGIWSSSDQRPFWIYMARFLPQLTGAAIRHVARTMVRGLRNKAIGAPGDGRLGNANTKA